MIEGLRFGGALQHKRRSTTRSPAPWRATVHRPDAWIAQVRPLLVASSLAFAMPIAAQSPVDSRAQVASARLGSGYAQMISLASTPDISAASYRIESTDPHPTLDVVRVPWQAKWRSLSPDADLHWKVQGGWLRLEEDVPLDLGASAPASIGSRWSAWSAGAGVLAKIRLGRGFTLEPALDVGIARLSNDASYGDAGSVLGPVFDGVLFNWTANAWLVTPGIALGWTAPAGEGQATLRGHVARSWIGTFDETDPVQHFNEAVNAYSLRAEYAHPTPWSLYGRALRAVGYAAYAGFFGANRDALGFDGVAEIGAGLDIPIAVDRPAGERLRLSAAWLVGSEVRGWTLGLGLQY